jgi:hypothetical protein
MNTIARKLTIFVLMAAAATTALTIGATTTFAASNTHTHDIQLMGKDDSWASSFTHTPVNWTGNVGSDDFNSAQYGGVQPHHHHSSTNMIADSSDNSNSTAGSGDFGDFNSAQNAWSHPYHHHSSTNMIADSGDNSNSTAGSDDRGGFKSAQYGSSDGHSHHHKDSTPNSSWMWPTDHTGSDIS